MNVLTKTYILVIAMLCLVQSLSATNIAIIESQSYHPFHKMDQNWKNVATALGHSATILPQSALESSAALDGFDILITTSGLINLSAAKHQTLLHFAQNGGSLYIQSEYKLDSPGNAAFAYLVDKLGGTFNWDGKSSGSLSPMNISGAELAPSAPIDPISYYWYGTYGSGDKTIIPILEFENKHYGFIFCPENVGYGKIVTISDQDWVRTFNNPDLMEGIINYLVSYPALTEMPAIAIEADNLLACDGTIITFTANLNMTIPGATLQWTVNGTDIIGANRLNYSTDALNEGDVVECRFEMMGDCGMFGLNSNPILISELFPLNPPVANINVNQTTACEEETLTFTSSLSGTEGASDIRFLWTINGEIATSGDSIWTINNLEDQDEVGLILMYNDDCSNDNIVFSNPIVMTILPKLDPTILIQGHQLSICKGDSVRFTANGTHWGPNPQITWTVDGEEVAQGQKTFASDQLEDGQRIQCIVIPDEACLSMDIIKSEEISITVRELMTPAVLINVEQQSICLGDLARFSTTANATGDVPVYQWFVDDKAVGNNAPTFETTNLSDGAKVSCVMTSSEFCLTNEKAFSDSIEMEVNIPITPAVSIQSDKAISCIGTEITFTLEGNHLGHYPKYNWMVDGKASGITAAVFSSSALNDGQLVSVEVTASGACLTTDQVISNPITVARSLPGVFVLEQESEKCGHKNGLIEVEGLGGVAPYSYNWNNGAHQAILTELSADAYALTLTDAIGCTATFETIIDQTSDDLISEFYILQPDCDANPGRATVFVNDANHDYTFEWSNTAGQVIANEQTINDLTEGTYIISVSNEFNCTATDTIQINASPAIQVQMPEPVTITLGEEISLPIYASSNSRDLNFSWNEAPGLKCIDCDELEVQPLESTTYSLEISNEKGCSITRAVNVNVLPKRDLFIPNAFTPNGDGHNDTFTIYAGDHVKMIRSVQVFDRWGSMLFSKKDVPANNESEGWDGSFGGKTMGMGVYIFQVEVEYIDGSHKVHSGDMSILP